MGREPRVWELARADEGVAGCCWRSDDAAEEDEALLSGRWSSEGAWLRTGADLIPRAETPTVAALMVPLVECRDRPGRVPAEPADVAGPPVPPAVAPPSLACWSEWNAPRGDGPAPWSEGVEGVEGPTLYWAGVLDEARSKAGG